MHIQSYCVFPSGIMTHTILISLLLMNTWFCSIFPDVKNNVSVNVLVHISSFMFLGVYLRVHYELIFSMTFLNYQGKKSNDI